MRSSRISTACSAWKSSGWATVVSEIRARPATAMSSNPTTERSRGHGDPGRLARLDQPDRGEVVPDEDGGRRLRPAQRVAQRHLGPPDPDRLRALPPPHPRRRLDARGGEHGPVAGVAGAVAAGLDHRRAHVADAAVAEVDQVLRRQAAALAVMRADRVGPLLPQPDDDGGDAGAAQRRRQLGVRSIDASSRKPATRCSSRASTPAIASSSSPSMLQNRAV